MKPVLSAAAIPSPFVDREDREQLERDFLALFDICVSTSDESEEAWAHGKLLAFYTGNVTHDDQPDFFEALRWAAYASDAELPW